MKPLWILLVAVASVTALAWWQHVRLNELRAESATLENRRAMASAGASLLENRNGTESDAGVSVEVIEQVHETMVEALMAFRENPRAGRSENTERAKQMFLVAQDFSTDNIATLVEMLQSDLRVEGKGFEVCVEIFEEAAPFALLEYLESHRRIENWQQTHSRCFRKCLTVDRKRALGHYATETESGNSDFSNTAIRSSVLLEMVADDPDKMLAMATSPEMAADPDALFKLGGFVDDKMQKPAEHLRFMTALRRATIAQPDSETLATIRKDYVQEMSGQLAQWPIDDVRTMVDSEFTPEEKLLVLEQASHRGDLEEKAEWANWFLKIDPSEWNQWIAGQPQNSRHPVIGLVRNWATESPADSAKWLERLPAGELRSATVLEYAWTIADRDPESAAAYLDELPESKGKSNLEKKIEEAYR